MGVSRRGLALGAGAAGALLIVVAFLVYRFSSGEIFGGWLVLPAFALGAAGLVFGIRSRSVSASVAGALVAGVSAFLIVGFVLFWLACEGVIEGNC